MVSADSFKIHRGELTVAHVDIYGSEKHDINRYQGMAFGLDEGHVRLCFLQYSNHPEVMALINKIAERDIYANKGFSKLPLDIVPDIVECFDQVGCIVFGKPRDVIMWSSGIIHLEMHGTAGDDVLLKKTMTTPTTTERYAIGTHTPVGLTQQDLREIGYMAHKGVFFHPYASVQSEVVLANSVHRKSTMWTTPRPVVPIELARFEELARDIEQCTRVEQFVADATPSVKKCFGIQ